MSMRAGGRVFVWKCVLVLFHASVRLEEWHSTQGSKYLQNAFRKESLDKCQRDCQR